MGTASREALLKISANLKETNISETLPSELLQVAAVLHGSASLTSAFTDVAAAQQKAALISRLFSSNTPELCDFIGQVASERWSDSGEMIAGIENLAIRAAALISQDTADELLAVAEAFNSSHELELSLGNRLANPAAKVAVIDRLFSSRVSAQTLAIVKHLIAYAKERKLSPVLQGAAEVAAAQLGYSIAEVTTSVDISDEQAERLRDALSKNAGKPVKLHKIIDPTLVGGVRVKLADEIIDGSVSSRLANLRLQLA